MAIDEHETEVPEDSELDISESEEEDESLDALKDSPESMPEILPRQSTQLTRVDPFRRYLMEISRFEAIDPETERELAVRYRKEGDQQAAYRLVSANLKLVVKIALLYTRVWANVMDLIQEGNIGLLEAVRRFDPFKGARLPTYASWWIKAYIIKFIIDNFRIVRIGTTNERRRLLFNLRKEK